jgi:NitT/TauT family transport system ATP-binding protein
MLLSALRVAIEWGRYGDLFEYDFNTGILNMPKNDGTSAE